MVLTFAGPDEMKLFGINDRVLNTDLGNNHFKSIRDACLGQRRRAKQTDWLIGTQDTENEN